MGKVGITKEQLIGKIKAEKAKEAADEAEATRNAIADEAEAKAEEERAAADNKAALAGNELLQEAPAGIEEKVAECGCADQIKGCDVGALSADCDQCATCVAGKVGITKEQLIGKVKAEKAKEAADEAEATRN